MIRLILIGAWACLATLASSYAASYFHTLATKTKEEQATAQVEIKKTKEIDIPKLKDGALKGYVVTQIAYTVNAPAQKKLGISPEAFVVDEAFKILFDDDSIDLENLKKYDLQKFTATVIKDVNARLKSEVITDLAIQEFTFLTAVEVRQHL